MTPLEDNLRWAFRAKADEVPPDAVPPLRLPDRRRRFFSLAYGAGERSGPPARPGWLAPAAAAVLVAALVAGSVALSRVMSGQQAPERHRQSAAAVLARSAAATRNEAATWVAAQVSRTAIVSCDPVMCAALEAHGIPAGHLEVLRLGTADPLGSAVIVATAAVRGEFGGRLRSVYAPTVIATFGSGTAQVDVRAIAPDGAAAYSSALSADLAARKLAGAQLLRNKRVLVRATARRQILAGQVDSRLLIAIAVLAARRPVAILAFGDSGPGAGPGAGAGAGAGAPLRSGELAWSKDAPRTSRSAWMRTMTEILHAQRGPFGLTRVEKLRLPGGQLVLRVEFGAPSPLGLLVPPRKAGA